MMACGVSLYYRMFSTVFSLHVCYAARHLRFPDVDGTLTSDVSARVINPKARSTMHALHQLLVTLRICAKTENQAL